jgi:hypothetical protein
MVLAISVASDHGVWGVYECIFSCWFQWHHCQPCPTSAARDIEVLVLSSCDDLIGPLIRVFGMSMDAFFHVNSNDTTGGHVRPPGQEISPSSHHSGPVGLHLHHHMTLYTLTSTCGGKGSDWELPSSHSGSPLETRDSVVIRIVFSLTMLPSLVQRWASTLANRSNARHRSNFRAPPRPPP